MKVIGSGWIAAVSIAFLSVHSCAETLEQMSWNWEETDETITLRSGDVTVWQFHYGSEASKPYFDPLALTDGTSLTWARPPDHPWHLGLWFSWKFINGLNYWEEDRQTGVSEGRTTVEEMDADLQPEGSARMTLELSYHPPSTPSVLTETRRLDITAPDAEGQYRINWQSVFHAETKVCLDRTPIQGEEGGKSWGGYAGLSIRLAKDTSDWVPLNSEGDTGVEGTSGRKSRWCCFTLKTAGGNEATVAIFDHPSNPRHPTPWYTIVNPDTSFGYFSPAFLYRNPLTLMPGETLELNYRILVAPDKLPVQDLETEYRRFSEMEEDK